MAKTIVAGDMYQEIDGQLFEIKRQLRQPAGYPFDPQKLKLSLQQIIEGKFDKRESDPMIASSVPLFKASKTNILAAVINAQHFSRKVLGVNVDIRKMFDMPTELPWEDVMVIYDPGFDNRKAIKKALKGQRLEVYQESDVMGYRGSSALGRPSLHIIENSLRPTEDTLGDNAKSPDELNADGRNYLDLRGYCLALGQRYFISKDFLDPETWTQFPKNYLPGGMVANCRFEPSNWQVTFCWARADVVVGGFGARLAIEVKPKT